MEQSETIPFSQCNQEELLLQYLPVLFSKPEELIFVNEMPSDEYLSSLHQKGLDPGHFVMIPGHPKKREDLQTQLWCFSPSGTPFLKEVSFPSWEVVKMANSKVETLDLWDREPIGLPVVTQDDLAYALKKIGFPCILKSEYGFSARGNLWLTEENYQKYKPGILQKLAKDKRFVLEPLLHRVFDFSSQWNIEKTNMELLGATICINDANGRYLSSIALPEKHPFLSSSLFQAHLSSAYPALFQLQKKGYFGPLGIDAFCYEKGPDELDLHPIVEMNARKTMGSVALAMQRRYFPNQLLSIRFEKNQEGGLLPKMGSPFNLHSSILEDLPSLFIENMDQIPDLKKVKS